MGSYKIEPDFIRALREDGATVKSFDNPEEFINYLHKTMTDAADGKCPVHGDEPCPPADLADAYDSKELLAIAKTALLGAVTRVNSGDDNAVHLRLAIADTAGDLYDRVLAREDRARIDAWGETEAEEPEPEESPFMRSMREAREARERHGDLCTETEREADLNAAMSRAEAEGDKQ
jgi:hypothetical protein